MIAGDKIMVGEFRDWQCDERESKKQAGAYNVFLKTFVVVGRDSIEVSQFADKGVRKDAVKRPAFKLGDKLVIKFHGYARTPYGIRVDGTCEALEPG